MSISYIRPREVIQKRPADPALVQQLAQQLSVSETLARILVGRGLSDFEQCKSFFNPSLDQLHDPFLFVPMEKAVRRIIRAIDHGEKIVIHGDYDVDGVTGTSVLVRIFRKLNATIDYYLPNRLIDGYGVTKAGLKKIADTGATLVITVDCGITAVEEAIYAKELGIDLIITDHHEPQEHTPDAFVVIDPKLPGETYPDKNLAGVGVGFKLAQAVCLRRNVPDEYWSDELDLVSIGTAADIVPLVGENRIIAAYGYKQIEKTRNGGLLALMREQNLEGCPIATNDVVFKLAPSINAAGRLGEPRRGAKLFISDDPGEWRTFARELVQVNEERRAYDELVQREAVLWAGMNIDFENEYCVVAGEASWHPGVIGISASKMVEQYCRPAFLFSIDEHGDAKGSGRSIEGCDLVAALTECSDMLIKFGGHKMAAGASLKADRLPEFRRRFNDAVKKQLTKEQLVPVIKVDGEVSISQLTPKFFEIIKRMEPFGPKNMRPIFLAYNVRNNKPPRTVGKGTGHLKLSIISDGVVIDAIAFGLGARMQEISQATTFTVAFTLNENDFMGKTTLQMNIRGISVD